MYQCLLINCSKCAKLMHVNNKGNCEGGGTVYWNSLGKKSASI